MVYENPQNVKNIFNSVSSKYDFLNNLFSFGLHHLWKRKLISLLKPKNGEIWADLCCGTGDISFLLSKEIFPSGSVIGIDIADEILEIAKNKSNNIKDKLITWKKKDIFDLEESNFKYDGICMSYGLRNLYDVEQGIKKVFLLLKDNGKAGFLDFNHSSQKSFSSKFQKLYLRFIVVPISSLFCLKKEYSYIEKSIEKFPKGKNLVSISKKIGFRKAEYKNICGQQMGILILQK